MYIPWWGMVLFVVILAAVLVGLVREIDAKFDGLESRVERLEEQAGMEPNEEDLE